MLLAQLMREWRRFPATLKACRAVLDGAGHDGRGQDTLGHLLALADLLLGPELATELGIPMVDDLAPWGTLLAPSTLHEVQDAMPNWRACLEHLLTSQVPAWRRGDRMAAATVGQLIEDMDLPDTDKQRIEFPLARRLLAQAGLGIEEFNEDGRKSLLLAIPNQSQLVGQLFAETQWQGRPSATVWPSALRQCPDLGVIVRDRDSRVYINGARLRCTLINLTKFRAGS
jgi:hypothetical protein